MVPASERADSMKFGLPGGDLAPNCRILMVKRRGFARKTACQQGPWVDFEAKTAYSSRLHFPSGCLVI